MIKKSCQQDHKIAQKEKEEEEKEHKERKIKERLLSYHVAACLSRLLLPTGFLY